MKRILTLCVLLSSLFFVSCDLIDKLPALLPHDPAPEGTYKRQIKFEVGGKVFVGVGVVDMQNISEVKIKGHIENKVDLIKFSTCHREEALNPPRKRRSSRDRWGNYGTVGSWDDDSREFEYTYIPTQGLEDDSYCLMQIGAFDLKGQHAWGTIDFNRGLKLSGKVNCNGSTKWWEGVSICQSRIGLTQQVSFYEPVKAREGEECTPIRKMDEDGKVWEYEVGSGTCFYAFVSPKTGNVHRHTTIGYDSILLRELD